MSQPFEIPLDVRTDENGECYVGTDKSSTFVVYTDGERPRLVIKPHRRQRVTSSRSIDEQRATFFDEIRRAESNFAERDGYVGYGYFLTHWKSQKLPFGVDNRKPVVEALIADGVVEVYTAPYGKDALRTR